jgi:hypothetical protein
MLLHPGPSPGPPSLYNNPLYPQAFRAGREALLDRPDNAVRIESHHVFRTNAVDLTAAPRCGPWFVVRVMEYHLTLVPHEPLAVEWCVEADHLDFLIRPSPDVLFRAVKELDLFHRPAVDDIVHHPDPGARPEAICGSGRGKGFAVVSLDEIA